MIFPNSKPSALTVESLTGLTQNIKMPDKFVSENFPSFFPAKGTDGKALVWEEMQEDRNALQYVGDLSRALEHTWAGVLPRQAYLVRLSYFFPISLDTLTYLRKPGTADQREGKQRLAVEAARLIKKFRMTEEVQMFKACSASHQILWEGITQTLENSKDSSHMPTAGVSWATNSATILQDLRTWKRLGRRTNQTNFNLGFLSGPTADHFYINTLITTLIQSTSMASDLVTDDWDQFKVANVKFTIVDDIYVDPIDSTEKNLIADNFLLLFPSEVGWSELMMGNVDIISDAGNAEWKRGPASYSIMKEDPVGFVVYMKSRFLALCRERNKHLYADLVP